MKYLNIIALILVGATLGSCEKDYLAPDLTSAVNAQNYFNSSAEIEAAVINMYDGLQGANSTSANDNHATQIEFYLTEMRSDNTRLNTRRASAQFESYNVVATNGIVADYYRSFYNVIFRANLVMANLDASADQAAAFEAEAKLFALMRILTLFVYTRTFLWYWK